MPILEKYTQHNDENEYLQCAQDPNDDINYEEEEMIKEENAKNVKEDDTIELQVNDAEGLKLAFRIKKTTKLQKLMQAFCRRTSSEITRTRFLIDGRRIQDDDTPESLEIENHDIIDVVLEQIGGFNKYLKMNSN